MASDTSLFKNRELYKSVCPYCGVGCGVIIESENGKVTDISGDPDHPSNYGKLCTKGFNLRSTIHKQDRLRHPLTRASRDSHFIDTSWDKALGEIAEKFKKIIRDHGPGAVAFHVSGQLLTEDYYTVNKLSKGFLKANNLDSNSRLCMSSAVMGYRRAFGVDAPPCSYEDLEHTDCVFIIGSNMAHCHPVVFMRLSELKELKGDNLKIIVADPRHTATASAADIHLPVNPGTDVALLNSFAYVLIDENLVNKNYIEKYTQGFEELKKTVKGYTPEKVSKLCGISAEEIRKAAVTFGKSGAAMTFWAMGLNQSSFGTDKNNALINLSIITGNIGKPGAGPFSLTGQANAMGGRETGGLANILPGHRYMNNENHRKEVEEVWGCTPMSAEKGLTAVEVFDGIHRGEIKALWVVCTNPVVSMPNGNRVEEALSNAELVVVQDIYHPTDTSLFADYILPAAGFTEKEGTMTNQERRVTYISKAVDPPGQAMPDWKIFTEFARHMGFGENFSYESAEDIFEEYKVLTKGKDLDITGVNYSRLKTRGPVQWPCPEESHNGTTRLYSDSVFWTDTGKANLVSVEHKSQEELTDDEYPMTLTTGRVRDQWHTMTKTGKVKALLSSAPDPLVEINREDAFEYGIEDNDLVVMESRRGKTTVRCSITDGITRGAVFLPFHWGNIFAENGRANSLTIEAIDSISQQPEFKACAVKIKKKIFNEKLEVLILGSEETAGILEEKIQEYNPNIIITRLEAGKDSKLEFHDPGSKKIKFKNSPEIKYDKMILAPGRKSYLPPLKGVFNQDVYLLNDYKTAKKTIGKMLSIGSSVVIGSGPNAFMVAELLKKRAAEKVCIISPRNNPLDSYLDPTALNLLIEKIKKQEIGIIFGAEIEEIQRKDGRNRILLEREKEIEADNIFIESRSRPDTESALELGLLVNKGIIVGEQLETNLKDIHSFGESAEVKGNISKDSDLLTLQANTLARIVAGDPTARYDEEIDITKFNLFDIEIISFGEFNSDDEKSNILSYIDMGKPAYKKIVVRNSKIVGGLYVGNTAGADKVIRFAREKTDISKHRNSLLSGNVKTQEEPGKILCTCMSVSEKEIEDAITGGMSMDEIKENLRAGVTCGTCLQDIKSLYNSINSKH